LKRGSSFRGEGLSGLSFLTAEISRFGGFALVTPGRLLSTGQSKIHITGQATTTPFVVNSSVCIASVADDNNRNLREEY